MGTSKFLALVSEGRLPRPVRIDGMTTWDRLDLDTAYEQMKQDESERRSNPIEEQTVSSNKLKYVTSFKDRHGEASVLFSVSRTEIQTAGQTGRAWIS